jgi:hypothetical protein
MSSSFTYTADRRGPAIRVALCGTGDTHAMEQLHTNLSALREDVLATKTSSVEFDLSKLYFINSTCIKALCDFVLFLRSEALTCKVLFLTDAKLAWQTRSLAMLERIGRGQVMIR